MKKNISIYEKRHVWNLFIRSIDPYSARIGFRRQNLTYVDVRFWRLKSITALYE